MNLLLLGINHQSASLEIREPFTLCKKRVESALTQIKKQDCVHGVVILSTCNRIEFYMSLKDKSSKDKILKFIALQYSVDLKIIKQNFYIKEDLQAFYHLLNVACGLDSQVLGETQVLGQVKNALNVSKFNNTECPLLSKVFKKARKVGKYVRRHTKISEGNVSIASIAIKLLNTHYKTLNNKKIVIFGVGKMSLLITKYLKDKNINTIFIANRTFEAAEKLAKECDGKAFHFDQMQNNLKDADIVISSTASPHYIISKEAIEECMKCRAKPLFLIDLAIPRDIDPHIKQIDEVCLKDLDNLKNISSENFLIREKEIPQVEKIIDNKMKKFLRSEKLWIERAKK